MSNELTPVPIDNRSVTSVLQGDLFKLLGAAHESFEALVFKAEYFDGNTPSDPDDKVGNLDALHRKLSYQSPIKVDAIELPPETQERGMIAWGAGSNEGLIQSASMLFSDSQIPEQSIVWIDEMLAEGKIDSNLYYVQSIAPIGKHGAGGKKHIIIPFRGDLDVVLSEEDEEIVQNDVEDEITGDLESYLSIP